MDVLLDATHISLAHSNHPLNPFSHQSRLLNNNPPNMTTFLPIPYRPRKRSRLIQHLHPLLQPRLRIGRIAPIAVRLRALDYDVGEGYGAGMPAWIGKRRGGGWQGEVLDH
jgi:hypothetical protein